MNHHDDPQWEEVNDDGDGESGSGGQTGEEIHFRFKDPYSVGSRDDLLPEYEIQRLLSVEGNLHKALVDKQKALRESRQAMKKSHTATQQQGYGYGRGNAMGSNYKTHPAFANQPEGMRDKQLETQPANIDEANMQTNPELKKQLDYQNRPENRAEPKPAFNPTPRPK